MRVLVLAAVIALATGCPASQPKAETRPRVERKAKRPKRAAASATDATIQVGLATWYGRGQMTASGERFDPRELTAAHRTLPFNSRVRVTHRKTGKSVEVRINDRGPFGSKKRIIDVSKAAAERLGIIDEGVAPVTVEVLERGAGRRKRGKK